ncbi:MAG: hypothetical protein MRY83_12080 [Flavobacteriales bacterium]|nr:hypothetical protein [Flavobacteriales bacterium]
MILILFGCQNLGKSDYQESLNSLAIERFKKNYEVIPNETNEYSLVFKRFKKMEELLSSVSYFVYDHKKKNVVIQDTLSSGSVKWHSSNEVIANFKDHSSTDKRSVVYKYDVKTREKQILN